MAKSSTSTDPSGDAPSAPTVVIDGPEIAGEFPVTVQEFLASESQTDRRAELLGAFYRAELKAGRVRDVPGAFRGRLVAFASQPA